MTVRDNYTAHGMQGFVEAPDWPPLTLEEADAVLRGFPSLGGARELVSRSPRPFSAGSIVETPSGTRVFLKRHALAVRSQAALLEEHRLMEFLARTSWIGSQALVQSPLASQENDTIILREEWVYEVHPVACGVDVYETALSWTPFLSAGHARAAGKALAQLHRAAVGYQAPARSAGQLITSYTIFAESSPVETMEAYLGSRGLLRSYAEARNWQKDFASLLLPFYAKLQPCLPSLKPLWTHNDFHASNLMWSGPGDTASVTAIVDFGLSDRTNAVHDLATAIERNIVEWLRIGDSDIVHLDHLQALLSGYIELSPLSYLERRALAAMLPLVHCEFALSETDYFLSVLHSETKARLAYEGYFWGHAEWFRGGPGRDLLEYLRTWAENPTSGEGGL